MILAPHNWHDDVIIWKHFPRNWPFVRGIHRSRWIPGTKASDAELWCCFFICAWINDSVNNREAGDLRRYHAHYDVIVMELLRSMTLVLGLDYAKSYRAAIIKKMHVKIHISLELLFKSLSGIITKNPSEAYITSPWWAESADSDMTNDCLCGFLCHVRTMYPRGHYRKWLSYYTGYISNNTISSGNFYPVLFCRCCCFFKFIISLSPGAIGHWWQLHAQIYRQDIHDLNLNADTSSGSCHDSRLPGDISNLLIFIIHRRFLLLTEIS